SDVDPDEYADARSAHQYADVDPDADQHADGCAHQHADPDYDVNANAYPDADQYAGRWWRHDDHRLQRPCQSQSRLERSIPDRRGELGHQRVVPVVAVRRL